LKTLALIPARGGSKGIPRKNIRRLAGKPLIAWSIQAALACPCIHSVVVTTEDEEIAQLSRTWGAQVPFMRPKELAQDDSPGMDPILHALDQLPDFDAVLILQPTSPLRTSADINSFMEFAVAQNASCAVSVCEPANSPYWMFRMENEYRLTKLLDNDDITRRQNLPPVYALNGALYFAKCSWLRQTRTFIHKETIGFTMPAERSIDIDTALDWNLAELLLSEST